MLVLSRRKDESVVINNDIRVVVVEIRGDKVRLGVEAPKEVPVHRSEVYEAISRGDLEVSESLAVAENGGKSNGLTEIELTGDSQQATGDARQLRGTDGLGELG